jgi:shikimate kinase
MQVTPNIFLIGSRACGKTSVGRGLATRLGFEFVDTDHVLVESVGMEISEYVDKNGWDAFRDRETEVLERVADKRNRVVGCGGGIILREKNRDVLKTGITLYLKVSPEELALRLMNDPNEAQRPSLTGQSIVDEVREVLAERALLYEACADFVLPQADLDEVVEYAVTRIQSSS